MPKLFVFVPVFVSSFMMFFSQAATVQAGGVIAGPFQVNIASGYEVSHFDVGKVEVEIRVRSTDGTTPMPSGNKEDYYKWELNQNCSGSCLKTLNQEPIAGSPTGRTNISYKFIFQETRGTFNQTKGRASGDDYEDGNSTGQISYTWIPTGIVSQPIILSASPTINSAGKTSIMARIDLGERRDTAYFVTFGSSDSQQGGILASLRVFCADPKNTTNPNCSIRIEDGMDRGFFSGDTLYFETKPLDLTTSNYFVVVSGRYINLVPQGVPIQGNITDDVTPTLQPGTIDTKDTSKAPITITLTKGATAKYNVFLLPSGSIQTDPRIPVIDCHPSQNKCSTTFQLPEIGLAVGSYNILVRDESGKDRGTATLIVTGQPEDRPGGPGSKPPSEPNCPPGQTCTTSSGGIRCDTSNGDKIDNGDGILTAIGCVPTEPQKLIQGLFRVGIGLGGAAALLLMIGGAFQFITSAGNPDAIKSATETFTQAIIGLLVIIFAVLLLQVIGVDILNIPGFTK